MCLLVLVGTGNYCSAQYGLPNPPLYDFMQQNADSTLIFTFETNWLAIPPSLMILSKKKDTISIYTYRSIYTPDVIVPRKIRDKLYQLDGYPQILLAKIDVNRFFSAKYIEPEKSAAFWKSILKFKPWQIKDDKHEGGEGCPLDPNNKNSQTKLFDGGSVVLDLITKDNIRHLHFYAPEFYEQKDMCPGRKARMDILEIEKVFFSYFGRW